MASNPFNPEATARVEIEYCAQCGFLPRAVWLAQELLTTFAFELRELVLVPGKGGILVVRVDGEVVFDRKETDGAIDPKVVKQLVRDRVAPERSLGHSDGR